jgi:hypothetical protein
MSGEHDISGLSAITELKGAHLDEEQLAALAMGASEDRTGHLTGCDQCGKALASHRALLRELDALPAIQPSGELVSRVRREIVSAMHAEREAGKRARSNAPSGVRGWFTASVVAVVGLIAVLALGDFTVLSTMDSLSIARWALALAVLGGAVTIARLAPRSSQHAAMGLGGALGAAVGLGVLDVLTTHPTMGEHLGCEMIMMLAALAPATAALLVLRRGSGASMDARGAMLEAAAGGAAGALAGQAALFTTCSSPEALVHVLVFHLLTFLGIVTASALLGRFTFSVSQPR